MVLRGTEAEQVLSLESALGIRLFQDYILPARDRSSVRWAVSELCCGVNSSKDTTFSYCGHGHDCIVYQRHGTFQCAPMTEDAQQLPFAVATATSTLERPNRDHRDFQDDQQQLVTTDDRLDGYDSSHATNS